MNEEVSFNFEHAFILQRQTTVIPQPQREEKDWIRHAHVIYFDEGARPRKK